MAPARHIVGVLLGGGQARRMGGGDKCLRVLAGRTLLEHVAARLEPQVAALVLNANGDPSRFEKFGRPVVADAVPGFAGPLAGVLAGMDWAAAHGADAIVSAATDAPFLPHDLVARLKAVTGDADIALAESAERVHPVIGLWPVRLCEDLRRALTVDGVRKVMDWTRGHVVATASFATAPVDPFFNINTSDDLAEAERLAVIAAPR